MSICHPLQGSDASDVCLLWTVGSVSARGHGGIWQDRAAGLLPEGGVLGGDTPEEDGDTPEEDGDVPVEDGDVPVLLL